MKINLDEGYSFGLGLFETIHIRKNRALFLKEHLLRLNRSIDVLNFKFSKIYEKEILRYLEDNKSSKENEVMKIILSEKNKFFLKRDYNYAEEQYKEGFRLNISKIKRNESSIFTYHKTLNYAENIYEKRKSKEYGYDEPLFLNTKGLITEGATSNIFFIKGDNLVSPNLESGLLNGIVREWIIKNYKVKEIELFYDDIKFFDEAFLTNSLFGIMPIKSIENIIFTTNEKSKKILEEYRKSIEI